ncbi:dnaJ homolog subfamily C member 1-like [Argiope bruennichi]|uniref:dnaJ homolog subfamily C member 1-like n=1 Tax=Argiope bruennichi TaxID=94029 RepID=UPI0024947D61|nr:dnaJ homolog subfamily C member 1-like [Argiope bruennichi]
MKLILFVALPILSFLEVCNCWTTEDLELFDLVESTPRNFYDILGVDEKASSSEIRKAYRKISTLLHPDRNKSPNAEEEFRQVAAVADVLRNDERRKQYDLILKMGLPDWRTPIYYYRRVRNMGLFEMTIFLFCLATLGQYIFAWTAYWEKKYEIEEVVLSRLRKKAKHQRKGKEAKQEEEVILSEALSILQKPKCQDLFPIRLFYFIIHVIKFSPSYIASCRNYFKIQKAVEKEEEEEEIPAPRVRTRKLVGKPKIPDYADISSYEPTSLSNESSTIPNGVHEKQNNVQKWCVDSLTEHQIIEFKKALKKFPVGTLQRWEKVAAHLGCSVSDVTAMVKQMKNNKFSKAISLPLQGVTGHEKENFGSELYEEKDAKEKGAGDHFRENGVSIEKCNKEIKENGCSQSNNQTEKFWKQEEQRSLEEALLKFPKDTESRWEKIAEFVSTKTKEECIERYKILVQQIKQKKGKGL